MRQVPLAGQPTSCCRYGMQTDALVRIGTTLQRLLENAEGEIAADAWATKLVGEPRVVSRIAKYYVRELQRFSPDEIMRNIVGFVDVEARPILPDASWDASGAEPFIANPTRADKSFREGDMYYDVVVNIRIPGTEKIVMVILNVEVQNRLYPWRRLEARVQYHMARLVSSQHEYQFKSPEYEKICDVYSVWIIPGAPRYAQNVVMDLWTTSRCRFGDTVRPVEEVNRERKKFRKRHRVRSREHGIIVWLGLPNNTEDEDLKFLDILFDSKMSAAEKGVVLEKGYGISPTIEIREDLKMMGSFSAAVKQATTQEVTERVTAEVTDRVTRDLAERMLRNPARTMAELLVGAGTPTDEIVTALGDSWPQMPAADIERIVAEAQKA